MTRKGIVRLDAIKEVFFVRTNLDQERVSQFATLYNNGADVAPIKVVRDLFTLVDGRHRKAALQLIGREEVECVLREPAPLPELLMEALADNSGGSLPPTRADINRVIKQLLENGVGRGKIADRLSELTPFPKKFIIHHIDDVQTEMAHARLRAAARAVMEDEITVKAAAEQYKVDVVTLRRELNPKDDLEKKLTFNRSAVMNEITARFKSTSLVNANLLSKLMKSYEAEDLKKEDLLAIVKKITANIRRMNLSHSDWVRRINVLCKIEEPGEENAESSEDAPSKRSTNGESALQKMGLS